MSKIEIENAEEKEAVQGQTETVVNGKPFNRMNDFYVKYVFASRQNKGSALALINSVFALDGAKEIVDFEFKDRELDPDRIGGKGVLLDVTGYSGDGTLVNVELQLRSLKSMDRRTLYYWSLLYGRRLEKGEKYSALNRTVVISILSYNLFKDEVWPEYHSSFAVLNTKDLKHKLTDDLEIHFIELPKWHKGDIEKMNRLEHWLAYLSPKTTNEERRRLAMKDPAIQKVMEAEKVFLADPDCITAYEQHEKYLRDMAAMKEYDEEVGWERGHAAGLTEGHAAGLAEGEAKGRAAGLAEGRATGLAEGELRAKESLIIKCHRNHMPVSDIAKLLEIDEEEVNRIILQNTDAAVES